MKSEKTIKEFKATAMLLGDGWWYDLSDHTFNRRADIPNTLGVFNVLDADTLEKLVNNPALEERNKQVGRGELGPSDLTMLDRIDQ